MKLFLQFILIVYPVFTCISQSPNNLHWSVKSNQKIPLSSLHLTTLANDSLFFKNIGNSNRVNVAIFPDGSENTFLEIGNPNTTTIDLIHRSANNNWYILGYTSETSNFTTPGAFRTEFDYNQNPIHSTNNYIAKFSSTGQLIWCTYIDFSFEQESGVGKTILTTDSNDNVYFVSLKPNDETIENSPFQSTANPEDYFSENKTTTITKLDSNGQYVWSTFFGIHHTVISNLITTSDGLIVTGFFINLDQENGIPVSNPTYFSTTGAYKENPNINNAGLYPANTFINKFSFDGTRIWGTYYEKQILSSDADDNGIYLLSFPAPTTDNAFLSQGNGAYRFGKLNSEGTELLWRTYLSNNTFESDYVHIHNKFSLTPDGNIWLMGETDSTNGIATDDAFQTEKDDTFSFNLSNSDGYHLLLSNDGSTVLYATYYGNDGKDMPQRIVPFENGYYSIDYTSNNSNPNNFITMGSPLEEDEDNPGTYKGVVYSKFSNTAMSIPEKVLKKVQIHPNPFEDTIQISGELNDFNRAIVYNMKGQILIETNIDTTDTLTIDGSKLPSGVYLLTIANEQHKQTYRIVKK
ncbi:T9SS type A sorting domain-containing protein [Capnocytophaga sp. ARDL2]|uniref:T9SS type A sorting domain-containing protein n=1 Tax=Capnocytophaga sp. ARDL2 TaxID=3238809 RepID=UPI003556158F